MSSSRVGSECCGGGNAKALPEPDIVRLDSVRRDGVEANLCADEGTEFGVERKARGDGVRGGFT